MIQVTSVEAVSDFRLVLTFNTGKRRCFDMRPLSAISGVSPTRKSSILRVGTG
jgi:hypothetical protein